MEARSFLLSFLLLLALAVPGVSAQVSVASHNIAYELRAGEVLVTESIVFENPQESEIHTFDGTVTLFRGNARDVLISGVDARVSNKTFPTTIYLDFSKSPIYRTATQNTRTVILTYTTRDFTTETFLDGGRKVNIFLGNVLPTLPTDIETGETQIKIRVGEGYDFGVILPPAEIKDHKEISYLIHGDERKIITGFFVEVHYADFKEEALLNIDIVKRRLDDARGKAEDAESAILNAKIYNANTTKAEEDLNASFVRINGSEAYLVLAEALLEQKEFYQAFLYTNVSVELAEKAVKAASAAEREASLQLRTAINEKISQLENMTATPSPTPALPVTEEEEKEKAETKPPLTPTVTPTPPREVEIPVEKEAPQRGMAAAILIILFIIAGAVLATRKGKGRKEKLAGVRDFRSIADLKRKSYKDFEEKVIDVKKETGIAGEIRRLRKEKEKYVLGMENLKKKRLAGEIDDNIYKAEKRRFEEHMKGLAARIDALEKELPKKGGLNGKGISDRP